MLENWGEGKKVALASIFAPPKSEKCLERAEKPTETLATQTSFLISFDLFFADKYFNEEVKDLRLVNKRLVLQYAIDSCQN